MYTINIDHAPVIHVNCREMAHELMVWLCSRIIRNDKTCELRMLRGARGADNSSRIVGRPINSCQVEQVHLITVTESMPTASRIVSGMVDRKT